MNAFKTTTINVIKNKKVRIVYIGICVLGGIGGALENIDSNINIFFIDSLNPIYKKLRKIDNGTLNP